MKFYLAARFSREQELAGHMRELEAMGHEVTSRWLLGDHLLNDAGLSDEADPAGRQRLAMEDYEDVAAADWIISFTEEPRTPTRGGRHVEFGIALALGKICTVIGPREHVFHCLPDVGRYDSWEDWMKTHGVSLRGHSYAFFSDAAAGRRERPYRLAILDHVAAKERARA